MKMLTKLEEMILLSVWRLGENAYGKTIYNHIGEVTGEKLSLGGVYFPLERMVERGFLNSYTADATTERRGLSKRYYKITEMGKKTLSEMKKVNELIWMGYPESSRAVDQEK